MNRLEWFRQRLAESKLIEDSNPTRLVEWIERKRKETRFSVGLISLQEARGWSRDPETGNIGHVTGDFFSIEGVRVGVSDGREVSGWDQPIFNQKEGGILAVICKQEASQILFLLQAKAEPGNIGMLQFAPTVQSTWSNLKRAHGGALPPLAQICLGQVPIMVIYKSLHNEEGGRFWKKTNSNELIMIDPQSTRFDYDRDRFIWASLSQIKELMLMDNMVNPFVKTVLAPL